MEGKAKEDEGTRQEREWKGQEVWERDRGAIKGKKGGNKKSGEGEGRGRGLVWPPRPASVYAHASYSTGNVTVQHWNWS